MKYKLGCGGGGQTYRKVCVLDDENCHFWDQFSVISMVLERKNRLESKPHISVSLALSPIIVIPKHKLYLLQCLSSINDTNGLI
jgi:hypothetical protein